MPSTRLSLALVGLLLVAGCAGISDPGETDTTPVSGTGTPTIDPPPADSPTTTVPPADVTDCQDLPDETRRSVEMAIENGSVLRDAAAFDELSPDDDKFVRCEGTTYALAWDRMNMRAEYGLETVERVNGSTTDSNVSVVSYVNLTGTGQRHFDRARNESELEMFGPDAFPDAFLEYRYVEYQGRYYRPLVVHADIPQWELRVEEVDAGAGG